SGAPSAAAVAVAAAEVPFSSSGPASGVAAAQPASSSAIAPAAQTPRWRRPAVLAGFGAVIAVIAVSALLFTRRSQALTEKDNILLTDFRNTTGDAVFDDALKQALAVDLEQSPFLNVFPEPRVQHAL